MSMDKQLLAIEGATRAVCVVRRAGNLSLVSTELVVTTNLASKWEVGSECNGSVMLIVCIRKALLGGIIFEELGIMDTPPPLAKSPPLQSPPPPGTPSLPCFSS